MNQDQLFKELNEFLQETSSIRIFDELDDKDRRFHFRDEWFLMMSFREESFTIDEIQRVLNLYYKNYSTSPSKSFTDGCVEIYDTLLPFFKIKDRQRKIKNILKYET